MGTRGIVLTGAGEEEAMRNMVRIWAVGSSVTGARKERERMVSKEAERKGR